MSLQAPINKTNPTKPFETAASTTPLSHPRQQTEIPSRHQGQDAAYRFKPVQAAEDFEVAQKKMRARALDIITGAPARRLYENQKTAGYAAVMFHENGGIKYLKGNAADVLKAYEQSPEPCVAVLFFDDTLETQLESITEIGSGYALRQNPFIAPALRAAKTVTDLEVIETAAPAMERTPRPQPALRPENSAVA